MTERFIERTLLPEPSLAPRCSEFSAEIGLRPAGTALRVDEVLVVDVALPWPKPVWDLPDWRFVPGAVEASGRRVRVLAAQPVDDEMGRLVHYVRPAGGAEFERVDYQTSPAQVASMAERLLRHGPESLADQRVETRTGRELLVCTQGSHDICCGREGSRVAGELAERRPDVSVRRVSHLGGHRFAPTAMSLPDGRMWGMASAEQLLAVVDRGDEPAALASLCRGLVGLNPVEQVAELAVFAELNDWTVDEQTRHVQVKQDDDGWECLVWVAGTGWKVRVIEGRTVPTITCRAAGGLPASAAVEYQAVGPVVAVDDGRRQDPPVA